VPTRGLDVIGFFPLPCALVRVIMSPTDATRELRRTPFWRSSRSGDSRKFTLDLLLRNVCRNAWETVVL
jgi:hypothetical protein